MYLLIDTRSLLAIFCLLLLITSYNGRYALSDRDVVAHRVILIADTNGLRQLIDPTEYLVDEWLFDKAQLLLDSILIISRILGGVLELGICDIKTPVSVQHTAGVPIFSQVKPDNP